MKEAYLYEEMDDQKVRCLLCNHHCIIKSGKKGLCNVRENRSGTLVSLVYGKVIASNTDPIAPPPCFISCPAAFPIPLPRWGVTSGVCSARMRTFPRCPPTTIGLQEERCRWLKSSKMHRRPIPPPLPTTYTAPTIYYELAVDTARLASSKGIKNVFVTNGYMSEQCLQDISTDLHAANVDLKSFSQVFYREQCGAKLDPVLDTLKTMKEMGVWLEVTTFLISGLNDSNEELKEISQFLADLDLNIPWHISRFHPTYRLTSAPATASLRRARDMGYEAGLKYVYAGNIPGDDGEKTYCHNCGEILIDRFGFNVANNRIKGGCCPGCKTEIPGVWS